MIRFNEIQELVADEFNRLHLNDKPNELYEPINYILGMGGKRIRPVLTLMSCSLFTDNLQACIRPAIGMEMFHNFTLIHDDIMDNANMRRNKPTVHSKWNNNVGILSGDAMCIKAYDYVMSCPDLVFKDVFRIFNRTALQVCDGQQYDMNFETRNDVTIPEYLKMIELKTAVLLAACLQIGALIGGSKSEDAELLYHYGINVGLAFQLQDDLLDVYADEKVFGKEIGKDIVSNKKTYLLLRAIEKADSNQNKSITQWLELKNFHPSEKVEAVKLIYDQLDIHSECKQMILTYFEKAESFLSKLKVDEAKKDELRTFGNKIKERIY